MFGRQHTFNSWHHYKLYSFSARIILRNGRIVKWNGMDVSEKWMIFQFTPYQTTTLPKWMFFLQLFFKSSLLLNGQCGIQVLPPNSSDDICHFFCHYPSSDIPTFLWQQFSYIGTEPTYKYFVFKGQVQKNFLSVKGQSRKIIMHLIFFTELLKENNTLCKL